MRWESGRRSSNVEDRRGVGPVAMGGGGIGMLLVVLAVSCLTGVNPLTLLQVAEQASPPSAGPAAATGAPSGDPQAEFVAVVLADLEDTWNRIFQAQGQRYQEPVLVLFNDRVQSACGFASAATGPFYCPGDSKVYLDLSFFRELEGRFGAPGLFARAYVIAHEVGHHIQNLTGINQQVTRLQRQGGETQANALSVRLELQADCLAGLWGHHAKKRLLDPGDVEDGLRAAAAIGDDRLQKQGQGSIHPETFTHGSSEQRQQWLMQGLTNGSFEGCNTFQSTTR
jgi:predicted metalloprotease